MRWYGKPVDLHIHTRLLRSDSEGRTQNEESFESYNKDVPIFDQIDGL